MVLLCAIIKLQASSPSNSSARQQGVLKQQEAFYLQDELAEVIYAHPQKMNCAAHVRFNKCKIFKASNCAHTPSRNPGVRCVTHVRPNVRILQASENLCDETFDES